ncbi:hypothetical protein [Deinococcus aestuarii]|uniref:hypothetical protein n=1 Tax=Deinococcus aestuarii TaxID=2774531 RepID=UPI001C0E75F6|nr:hypothetical protein [Deinococcus aestuarii]
MTRLPAPLLAAPRPHITDERQAEVYRHVASSLQLEGLDTTPEQLARLAEREDESRRPHRE